MIMKKKQEESFELPNNLFDLHEIFVSYGINSNDVITAFTCGTIHTIEVKENKLIITYENHDPFVIKYKGVMSSSDRLLFKNLKTSNMEFLKKLRQTSDRLQSNDRRAKRGAYYTEQLLSLKVAEQVLEVVRPDFIAEPFAGVGSLILPFVNRGLVRGWINDYDEGAVAMLRADYSKIGYRITNWNIIEIDINKICNVIDDKAERPLFITNPPFNSTLGKKIKKIDYTVLGKKYGKGSQLFPSIGKLIDVIKRLNRGYLAFFAPMGLFCERKMFNKLLKQILNQFDYLGGFIYSGKRFNDVTSILPVSFTIWRFGGHTDIEDMKFVLEDGAIIGFKRHFLLKDGWRYSSTDNERDEIVAPRNERFNTQNSKIFVYEDKGIGSRMVPENVKIDLEIEHVPSELVYGLWSACVGLRAIVIPPLHFGNAYVHMPNFSRIETMEILTYVIMFQFLSPDYTQGRIGFIGPQKEMKFGVSQRLNDGVHYLIDRFNYLKIDGLNIKEVLERIKNNDIDKQWPKLIRNEIRQRLEIIGYWDCIPLPLKKKD